MTEQFDGIPTKDNTQELTHYSKSGFSLLLRAAIYFGLFILLLLFLGFSYIQSQLQPPADFPINQQITISPGMKARDITQYLADQHVVASDMVLYYVLVTMYDTTNIKASTYLFDQPLTTVEVAERLTQGDFDTDLVRFTHFEGERATTLAKRAAEILPNFDATDFLVLAEPHEGKLFPDTYFFPPTFTASDLADLLLVTYEENVSPLRPAIEQHPLTESEVLVLASIIEREANTPESMKIVSGILQNRLAIGMPLQADASIEYILDKPLAELTPDDLDIDSPYNTYLNTNLPPTPIGNPGLDSIKAVLEPTESDYFYYITDDEGEFHYAKTYREHLINIERYLR